MSNSKTPSYDAKVKIILDATIPGERVCALTGEKWVMDEEEISWYKKFNVPPSTIHPDTRNYIMTCFWLTFSWWWNKHAETGEPILTYVHPATGIRVLPDKEWFDRDFTSKGLPLDFNKPFFDQLRALQLAVPLLANRNDKEPENSITMFSHGDVNSYFVMFCRSKNSFFSGGAMDVEEVADVLTGESLKQVYNSTDSLRSYNCRYVRSCRDCMDTYFAFDCRNCEHCFGAWNKRNAKYLWWNEQLSKEEWEKRFSEVRLSSRSVMDANVKCFQQILDGGAIWPENFNEHAVDSLGDYLRHVTNMRYCINSYDDSHDSYRDAFSYGNSYESAFCASNINSNNCFGSINSTHSAFLKFCDSCQSSQNLEYCLQCFNCEDCFGCVGLNRKKYCILNTQYSEAEYGQMMDKIKTWMLEHGWYGQPLPAFMGINPFAQSGAVMYMGAPREIGTVIGAPDFPAEAEGALGHQERVKERARSSREVPDCIDDVGDDLLGQPFYDEEADRYFAFIKPELDFYRKNQIPPPNRHFMDRLNFLSRELNVGIFKERSCAQCGVAMTVAENPTYKSRKIFCNACYLEHLEKNG